MNAGEITSLHLALCRGLQIEPWMLSANNQREWTDFLRELACLEETSGGPVRERDIAAVIALMWRQKRDGTPWGMRYSRILRDPETFRDLVLETRRVRRPRAPIEPVTRTQADGAKVLDERDPAASAEAVRAHFADWREKMKGGPRRPE